ncbi:uncharacterized protein BJX67DRAFT_384391 [Aspergillus lucknowensis]|uniref:D-alanine--D-alanine ligase C-terminal domain-containing protein n=1 Tax=Aspergillus lucknowensis TaxID=176173 RepID=A0ABR4LGK4_9EURO
MPIEIPKSRNRQSSSSSQSRDIPPTNHSYFDQNYRSTSPVQISPDASSPRFSKPESIKRVSNPTRKSSDDYRRYSGTVNHCGRHSNDWLFGGLRYRDSGADIAYTLSKSGTTVITPGESPDPANQDDWCFPDTEEGILDAVQRGATHLWANTVVGQLPLCVDRFDDKAFLNDSLRRYDGLMLPKAWTINGSPIGKNDQAASTETLESTLATINESDYPIVAKPVRGRGSHAVKICHNAVELKDHASQLLLESPQVLLEEHLCGEEGTITIMPPSQQPIPGLKQQIVTSDTGHYYPSLDSIMSTVSHCTAAR